MVDIVSTSSVSGSPAGLSAAEVVASAPVRVAPPPSREYFVSPYTLIDSSTSKAILVLRDTATGDVQVQVPAQVNIDSSIAAENLQQAQRQAQFVNAFAATESAPAIEPSAIVVVQNAQQEALAPSSNTLPVPEIATAAFSAGAQLSVQPVESSVSLNA
ncbi:MAG: hypothetical protein ACRBDL_04765 [Alphaproteobacteria bacterium]